MNTLKARWVAEKYWLYVRGFTPPDEALDQKAWLVFDQLDLNSIVLLNGVVVGTHSSAFVPCRIDVTGKLKGKNLIQVAIESGLYSVAEKEGSAYLQNMGALLNKRHWLRKPQYQFLWDWNPQLINVGITGTVKLEWGGKIRLDQIVVQCRLSDDLKNAKLIIKSFLEGSGNNSGIRRTTVKETGESNTVNADIRDCCPLCFRC